MVFNGESAARRAHAASRRWRMRRWRDEEREIGRARRNENTYPERTSLRTRPRQADALRELGRRQREHRLHERRIRIDRRGEFGECAALDDRQRGWVTSPPSTCRGAGQRDARDDFVIPRLDRPVEPSRCARAPRAGARATTSRRRPGSRADGLERCAGLHVEGERRNRQRQGLQQPPSSATAAAPATMRAMAARVARERDVRDTGAESMEGTRRTDPAGPADYNRRMRRVPDRSRITARPRPVSR